MWSTVEGHIPSRFAETSFMDVKMLPSIYPYIPEKVWMGFFLTPKVKVEEGSFWFFICMADELKKQLYFLLLHRSVSGFAGTKRGHNLLRVKKLRQTPERQQGLCSRTQSKNHLSSGGKSPEAAFSGSPPPATVEARREVVGIFFLIDGERSTLPWQL